ncbi:hypothetical protein RB653_001314 [Dictyostelium firmibasis]|uniref:Uncharacterized protein n=1 Tax=Dictyostelium firmibasis TaxID=79012 RepID=A0AAN7UGH0_9MYCE
MIRKLLPQIINKQQNLIKPINNNNNNSTIRLFCTSINDNNIIEDDREIGRKILLARNKKNKNSQINIKKFLSGNDIELKEIIEANNGRNNMKSRASNFNEVIIKGQQEQQEQQEEQTPFSTNKFIKRVNDNNNNNNKSGTISFKTKEDKKEEEKEKILEFTGRKEIAHGIFINPDLSNSDKRITIVTGSENKDFEAKELAKELNLDYLPLQQVLKLPNELFGYQSVLFVQPKGVTLHDFEPTFSKSKNNHVRKMMNEILLDYTEGTVAHRTAFGKNKKSPIIRSICRSNGVFPDTILDVTGGLGKDAWIMASFGSKVTIIERNPVLVYLIERALSKALLNPDTSDIASRITLIHKDSIEYLVENFKNSSIENRPQVIFMDPMYQPKKTEKSLSKKDIRAVRKLVGGDRDSTTLFALSRRFATNRVVWKRPRGVLTFNPDIEYKSTDTCFYVYLTNKSNN